MLNRQTREDDRESEILEGAPAADADTLYTRRARFYHSGNAFDLKRPAVPRHLFVAERDRAFDLGTPTGFIDLDLSDRMAIDFPATTPLILTRYLRLRAGESFAHQLKASGEIYYVFAGTGESANGDDVIAWGPGDVFTLPGGAETRHRAGDEDCVLWLITNEPELALEHAEPPALGNAPVEATHFRRPEIARQLQAVYETNRAEDLSGLALVFASEGLQRYRNISPSFTLALNSLPPGDQQRAHRHNSAAITLCIQGQGCWSMIEGERVDWSEHAVMVTPPADEHSHHNGGSERMLCLIVQDGGLHYHCRTMGFEFTE